jgi:hypothetical protein
MPKTEGALCAYAAYAPVPAAPPAPTAATAPRKPATPRPAGKAPRKPPSVITGEIGGPTRGPPGPLKPALASIRDACAYMGGVSRAKFYVDILPQLDTVKLGKRNFVVVASMDRLIEASRRIARCDELASPASG